MSRTWRVKKGEAIRERLAKRRWLLIAMAAAVLAWPGSLPSATGASGVVWPEHRFDLANTGANLSETTITPANVATLGLDWSSSGRFRSSPAVAGGVMYLSCERADVCAVDVASGAMVWRRTVGQDHWPEMPVVAGGVVYVGWSRPATVTALDASTGVTRWSTQITTGGYDMKGPAVVAGGLVYQAVADGNVHALDALTGARRWTTPVPLPSSPAFANGVLYVGGAVLPGANRGTLYALRAATGEILWKRETTSADRLQSPVVSGGRFQVPLNNGYFSAPAPGFAAYGMVACNAGPCQPLWTYTSSRGSSADPATSGGVVYQGFHDGYLHALEASTGRLLWLGGTPSDTPFRSPGPPTVINGLVFSSGDDGFVYAWPTSGCTNAICKPVWAGDVGERTLPLVRGSEVTVVGGRVLVVNSDGVLSSFSPKAAPGAPPAPVDVRTVRSWGLGDVGQLGTGSLGNSTVPRLATGAAGVTKVAAGGFHTVALRKDAVALGWGSNQWGQSGGLSDSSAPVNVPNASFIHDVSAGVFHSLYVSPERTVMAMGANTFGALGVPPPQASRGPILVPDLTGVDAVAAGGYHSLALKDDGTVWSWGSNFVGQLGTGSTTDSSSPSRVPGLERVVAISAGLYHSLALRDDGTVWAWGWNGLGAVGTGRGGELVPRPAPVPGLSNIRSLSAGGVHSLATAADGGVWAWGWNGVGQLGTGRSPDIAWTPISVPISGVAAVAAGGYHSLALKSDGTVWSWGWNAFGQLGNGSTTDSALPLRVLALQNATAISSGLAHSAAAGP